MRVPLAFRRVTPGVTWLAREVLADRDPLSRREAMAPLVTAFMPSGTAAQRRWWWAQYQAIHTGGPYLEWVARHGLELGASSDQIRAQVHDIGDWVATCYAASAPLHVRRAVIRNAGLRPVEDPVENIARPFHPRMSVRTVRELCADWHEAVALSAPESSFPLPPPWREAATIGGIDIIPLATAADIIDEGKAMHHCARAYIQKVCAHECCLFSARHGDKRLATIEVERFNGGVSISQMRGPCNAVLPKATQELLKRWCGQRNVWADPAPEPSPHPMVFFSRPGARGMPGEDDGIPF
jgi:pimeloyl-ACP methyl ester carboxylesterase